MDFEKTFPLRFLVNLGRRQDRRIEAEEELEKQGVSYERFPAIDAKWLRRAKDAENPGWYACAITQSLVVREAMKRDAEAVLILEDDVVFDPLFREKVKQLELPEDWGAFYFGCQHCEEPEVIAPGLVEVARALDFHAFAIRKPYYRAFLEAVRPSFKKGAEPYSAPDLMFADYHPGKIPCYAAYPNLVWQRIILSDNTKKNASSYNIRGRQYGFPQAVKGLNAKAMGRQSFSNKENFKPIGEPINSKDNKIAFLFLTREGMAHPDIWKEYFEGHEDTVSFYCHAKAPKEVKEEWLKKSIIDEYVDTEWGDISLVKATLALLKEALKNEKNQTFVLVSEECVPVKPLSQLKRLRKIDRMSWLKLYHADKIEEGNWRLKRLEEAQHKFDADWLFHSQWFMLNREVVDFLLQEDMTDLFKDVHAPDESYFGTTLNCRGYPLKERFTEQNITYSKIEEDGDAHPLTYKYVKPEFALELARSSYFFARKFSPESNISDYRLHVD